MQLIFVKVYYMKLHAKFGSPWPYGLEQEIFEIFIL